MPNHVSLVILVENVSVAAAEQILFRVPAGTPGGHKCWIYPSASLPIAIAETCQQTWTEDIKAQG
jgi:hypothetical protein